MSQIILPNIFGKILMVRSSFPPSNKINIFMTRLENIITEFSRLVLKKIIQRFGILYFMGTEYLEIRGVYISTPSPVSLKVTDISKQKCVFWRKPL